MESLTLQVDGPITRRASIRSGAYNRSAFFVFIQVDEPITGGAYKQGRGGGGLITRIFRYPDNDCLKYRDRSKTSKVIKLSSRFFLCCLFIYFFLRNNVAFCSLCSSVRVFRAATDPFERALDSISSLVRLLPGARSRSCVPAQAFFSDAYMT